MRLVGVAVALVVVLAGCSRGDAEPKTLPALPSPSRLTTSPSAPAASSPAAASPAAPSSRGSHEQFVPRGALAKTSEGAEAFGRYYMSALQKAFSTGDAAQFRALSDAGCGGCNNLASAVDAAARAGQHVRGGEFRVLYAAAPSADSGDVVVDLRYSRESGELIDAAGKTVQAFAAEGTIDAQLRLKHDGARWRAWGFRQVSS